MSYINRKYTAYAMSGLVLIDYTVKCIKEPLTKSNNKYTAIVTIGGNTVVLNKWPSFRVNVMRYVLT